MSGTHEELKISLDNDIPKHVYIKLGKDNDDTERIINEINKNQISFYRFKDDKELLTRIKETVFTIARDIMIRKVEQSGLNTLTIRRISVNHDYNLALGYLKIFEALKKVNQIYCFGYLDSNLIMAALDNIFLHRKYNKYIFIDNKLNNLLDDIMIEYNNFTSKYVIDYTSTGNYQEVEFPIYDTIRVVYSERGANAKYSREEYHKLISNIFEKYNVFKDYVKEIKTDVDILSFQNYLG